MLTALDTGVQGGVWFSLIDKVYARRTLEAAWRHVRANHGAAGVDHVTIAHFDAHLDTHLLPLSTQLQAGTYRPQAVRRVFIEKPGTRDRRPLGIPTVRDRVVQAALRLVLEPIFERDFAAQSYGFRPNRGCQAALRRVQTLLDTGYTWVVDADFQHFFDTIPHDALLARVREKIADGRVLALLDAFLTQAVLETAATWTPETGTPQGAVISPLLSNIYLDPLDHHLAEQGLEMVRYADDLVVLCRTEQAAQAALATLAAWTTAAGLQLHPDKTRLVDATQPGGFDFLGYHFERGYRWPRTKSLRRFKDTLRAATRRTNGQALAVIIATVTARTRGWYGYFRHSHWTTFAPLDAWIRMRLRSLLRHRLHRAGRGRGHDHHRWPNVFFTTAGLFSLVAAHAVDCESSRRSHP
jgi:RNA-directed DNA polymerase